ncbi:MAG: glycoside hydrolase family 3 N-terminal domain-containing protein [Ardenticatenales bacterium]
MTHGRGPQRSRRIAPSFLAAAIGLALADGSGHAVAAQAPTDGSAVAASPTPPPAVPGARVTPSAKSSSAVSLPPTATAPSDPAASELSPERKVAQLLVVAFYAPNADDPLAGVLPLVAEWGIGGVVLQAGNNVFGNHRGDALPARIGGLTADLQRAALTDAHGVPLFVAADHEGNGAPLTHLREGFTALPSAMAIGAGWDPDNAAAVGEIVGREMEAVGVNVLLGPVLDVLANPHVDNGGDIGTRAFGGHPYWVGRMGARYIEGVHAGSRGRVLTVAKHFPGHGDSDRLPDQEVPVVTKDFASLETIELPPFGAVTTGRVGSKGAGGADDAADADSADDGAEANGSTTDALMTAHIRYRGLSGNAQRASLPVSFDRAGLATLFSLEHFHFGAWHESGGLILSDSLGVPAVKRWFDPSGRAFPHRQIARDALLAGNDVLILAQFAQHNAWSEMRANVEDTIRYFADEYRRDRAFRTRVDAALDRVLAAKHRLYPSWAPDDVVADANAVRVVGSEANRAVVERVTAAGLTAWQLPERPPGRGDRLVIIHPERRVAGRLVTDDGGQLACANESCGLSAAAWARMAQAGPTLVEGALMARYGPRGAGLIDPADVRSYAMCQIEQALSPALAAPGDPGADEPNGDVDAPTTPTGERPIDPPPDATPLGDPGAASTGPALFGCDPSLDAPRALADLEAADWIVVAFGELEPDAIRALRGQILPQLYRIAAVNHGRIAVLSFGPPYYVDETNAARLDAHISAYTRIPAAVDAAVAALFGDGVPTGASPVSVDEAGYDLAQRLDPDPASPLALRIVNAGRGPSPRRIEIAIDPIHDANGHPVPDGTVVDLSSEPASALDPVGAQLETRGGAAGGTLTLREGGAITLHARAGAAGEREAAVIDVPPAPAATPPPAPPRTTPAAAAITDTDPTRPGGTDLAAALGAAFVFGAGATGRRRRDRGERVGAALRAIVAALAVYCLYAAGLRFGAVHRPAGLPAGLDSLFLAALGALIGAAIAERFSAPTAKG